MVSEIIPVFSRKAIFGYPAMVAASVAIGFISLSVWAHHMFTVGMGPAGNTFFVFSTMVISVPTGIKIFNWLGTLWGGKILFNVPMMFCLAFLFQFLSGGLDRDHAFGGSVQLAAGGSYFVIAHFHYVIGRGNCYCAVWGFLLLVSEGDGPDDERDAGEVALLALHFGFHLTFDFMHVPGMLGMPRRIYTYEAGRGWEGWNLIVGVGAFSDAGTLIFVYNMVDRTITAREPDMIRGTRGRWSGRRLLRHPCTTLR